METACQCHDIDDVQWKRSGGSEMVRLQATFTSPPQSVVQARKGTGGPKRPSLCGFKVKLSSRFPHFLFSSGRLPSTQILFQGY